MPSRASSPTFETLEELIAHLSSDPEREPIAAELGALQSIYGDDAVRLWRPRSPSPDSDGTCEHARRRSRSNGNGADNGTVRYEVTVEVSPPPDPDATYSATLLVSLPSSYPASSPPQLQLLSRYIGPFGVDPTLFGTVLRTYISMDGVEWSADGVCVFDGIEWVKERCVEWASEKLNAAKIGELVREDERPRREENGIITKDVHDEVPSRVGEDAKMPEGIEFVVAEPIVDRKSIFIGRACKISDPSQVPIILAHLMSDRRIARAAHPVINAWRCRVGDNLHQDNDDDGETAAGGRLAHLLQILEVENVLVVVTRYFGGIHLGPDRFKHINQAARNSLESGGFLDALGDTHNTGRKKGKSTHAGTKR